MFKRVIVGLDGSKPSFVASHYGLELGSKLNIPVVGIHVLDSMLTEESLLADLAGVLGFSYYEGISAKVKEFLEKESEALLDEFSALGRKLNAKVSTLQTWGNPAKEIALQGDLEDIIFVGKPNHDKSIKGIHISSVSEQVIKRAECPVFVAFKDEYKPIENIMICHDGKDEDDKLLDFTRNLNNVYNAKVFLYHADEFGSKKEKLEKLSKDYGFELIVEKAIAEEGIVSNAENLKIDLVIMGSHKKKLVHFFMGSTTTFVFHYIKTNMLVVK
jgi:Universal stress protein UspA and related nucleotide-binding proteins